MAVPRKRKAKPEVVFEDKGSEEEIVEEIMQEKKSTRYFLIAVGTLVIILLLLVIVPAALKKGQLEKDMYSNFIFKKEGRFWVTEIEKNNVLNRIPFYYHPRELEKIPAERGLEDKILNLSFVENGSIVYTVDPDLNSSAVQAGVQVSRITGDRYNILNIPTKPSGILHPPADYDGNQSYPIVTCEDADNSTVVVVIRTGSATALFSEGNCIIVQGASEEELVKVAERLDYMLLKIMK
ncbi:MAG: hypothetical protein ABIJ21_03095 [Nanoarchaeota archaeon]